ncbi:zinc finger and BTB domain-containing protein 40-like [Notothenia coriiceps]|uniref:Zinc finger and BTB domain-containing protein 40-like n=1 Tax=Notothenia coriiceps TaxID=8208 RepID=A0A6I9P657_9TELE|nr:PREDICTED: zinc finger and BTB domain-containing protein 40-like [Notothenia coriiceps]
MFANHTRQLKTLCQCDVCFKFFPSAASVAKHQAAEHQGSTAAMLTCPYCPAVLGGEEELQEHLSSQHLEASSCPFCSLLCCSQLELQEHLLSCHMEAQEEQGGEEEQESSSHTVSIITSTKGLLNIRS